MAGRGAVERWSPRGVGLMGVGTVMGLVLLAGAVAVFMLQRAPRPTHVVLVVLDTVRSDRLGCYGYPAETSPHLDALADEGLLFERARAPAPWTLPSHASLFTGLRPADHGCTWEQPVLAEAHATLAERLRDEFGFATWGITSNVNASSRFGLDQGFDVFDETWSLREAHRGLDDSRIVNARVAELLEDRDALQPFFLFVNYLDAHLPYTPDPPWDRSFGTVNDEARSLASRGDLLRHRLVDPSPLSDETLAGLGRLYDGEVRQVDQRLGELLAMLEQEGIADDTLVIVTSDHGELLGEAGGFDHQLSLREELLRVPLVVRFPHRASPTRVPTPVSLTAVSRWVLTAAEGAAPRWVPPPEGLPEAWVSEYARPTDLLHFLATNGLDPTPYDRRRAALYRRRDGVESKLLIDSLGRQSLHQLTDGQDEGAGSADDDALAATLSGVATRDAALQRFLVSGASGGGVVLDDRARAELEALGYLSPQVAPLEPALAALLGESVRLRDGGDLEGARALIASGVAQFPGHPDLLHLAATLAEDDEAEAAWRAYVDAARDAGDLDSPRTREAVRRLASDGANR